METRHRHACSTRRRSILIAGILVQALLLHCATGDAPYDVEELEPDSAAKPEASVADSPVDGSQSARPESGPRDDDAATVLDARPPEDTSSPSVAVDAGPPPVGIRCGGGAFAAEYCTGATPLCCQSVNDAGAAKYACVPAGACSGYPIACAGTADCAPAHLCCQYKSAIKCEPQCQNANRVCDLSGVSACPAGMSCSLALVTAGVASPYLGCE